MEFYELNRLYDANLQFMEVSKTVDGWLYSVMPVLVSLGCGVSLLTVLVLLQCDWQLMSKNYLVSQAVCNLLFQLVSSLVLITNNYEQGLLAYFNPDYITYLHCKMALNFIYNVLLYCVIWLFTVGCLDFTVLSLIKLGALSSYAKVHYKLFIQQVTQFNDLLNCCQKTEYSFAPRANINPVFGGTDLSQRHSKLSLTSSDLDEAAIFELDRSEHVSFNYSNYEKNQLAVYCSSKKITVSVFLIAVFSGLLALPHFRAYEVKNNDVSVSPMFMPQLNNEDLRNMIHNIYFIKDEVSHTPRTKKTSNTPHSGNNDDDSNFSNLVYSENMAKAYGITLAVSAINQRKLARIRRTHPRFFNITGIFDLSSKHYWLCNTLKNKEILHKPDNSQRTNKQSTRIKENINMTNYKTKLQILDLSLICIKKNEMNGYLAYNTLYFWLEHTLIVSVPIFINSVVAVSMASTFWKYSTLLVQQSRLSSKRQCLNENLAHLSSNQNIMNKKSSTKKLKPKRTTLNNRPKCVQIQTEVLVSDYEDDVFFEPQACQKEVQSQIEIDAEIHQSQSDYNKLNLMFLVDLLLYICIAFPYSFMRLALDLFVKDRIKISLDFFILYKIAFISFHIHMIAKFFLLISFNTKFRVNLASLFAIGPAYCCISAEDGYDVHNKDKDSHGCCIANGRANESRDNGEFFNVNLHTKMQSNYEQASALHDNVFPENEEVIVDFNDENLVKTNV